jgi:hypothetical protein
MMSKTPGEKVRTYKIFIRGSWAASVLFGVLGLTFFIHHFVPLALIFIVVAAIFLTAAFASSSSKFAKEAEVIEQFCRERRCDHDDYPTSRAQCDELRRDDEIFLELTSLATAVIEARQEIDRRWRMRDLLGEKAAKVREQNARSDFRHRWCYYRSIGDGGILPFKNPIRQIEWRDEEEFLSDVLLGMVALGFNAIGQRYA